MEITQEKVNELLQRKREEVVNNVSDSIKLRNQVNNGFVELKSIPLIKLIEENDRRYVFKLSDYGNRIEVGSVSAKFSKLFPMEYQNEEFIRGNVDQIYIQQILWVAKRQLYYHVYLKNLPDLNEFIVEKNDFLDRPVQAFYHTNYKGYGNSGNPNYINVLKNEGYRESQQGLNDASKKLKEVLSLNIPEIRRKLSYDRLLVVVVPRSKSFQLSEYQRFRISIKNWTENQYTNGIDDGTEYIKRIVDTKCTHLNADRDNAPSPYKGITSDTCQLTGNVAGKHVLLIDDIYTPYVNIDEDAIQFLLDNNAASVTLYTIGRTFK